MKRDNIDLSVTPPDLREAEELLIRYGLWAQDRYKKRRCASAEGQYRAPPTPGEEPMPVLMADFAAMDVQRALQVVPRQYSRVLAAVYIPKAESELSARLRMGIKRRLWHDSRVQGLRLFWGHYLRRISKNSVTAGANLASSKIPLQGTSGGTCQIKPRLASPQRI